MNWQKKVCFSASVDVAVAVDSKPVSRRQTKIESLPGKSDWKSQARPLTSQANTHVADFDESPITNSQKNG